MTAKDPQAMEGGCTCQSVRYRLTASPMFVHCCHSRWCQRETGSAFVLNALVEADGIELLSGQVEVIDTPSESGKGQKIHRCPICKIALWSNYAGAGDRIVLVGATGHDPALEITGCYNPAWVTITAQTNLEPVLTSVHFRGSGFWRLDGLSFVNQSVGVMVRLEDHGSHGPVQNIQIINSHFTSGDLPTIQDWVDHVSDGMRLYSAEGPIVARCNEMVRVAMGFVAFGSHINVINNRVEYFSRDGIATGGHFNRFIGNRIFDSVKLGDGHHDDFFQSHTGANPDTSSDIEITGNMFVNRYSEGQPAGSLGPTQCLSGFEDGPKQRLRITNNLCKADYWHGITWYDTNDSVVINNTVIGGSDYPGLPPGSESWPTRTWISVEGTGNIVRNNITTRNLSGGDHNHEVLPADVDLYFTDWIGLDFTLAPGSPAIDAGNPDGATTHDILGAPRGTLPDVGAYEY